MNDEERMARLEEKVTFWMETTTEYRKALCAKIDHILEIIGELPCKERREIYMSVASQLGWIWKIIYMVIPILITLGVGWGSLHTTVMRNTEIIIELQKKSYEYRDIQVVTKEDKTNGSMSNP